MLGDCASVATLRRDRFSERSYLFTMSDNTPAHQASRPDGAGERRSLRTSSKLGWWSQTESNRRPPACKAGALPTELWPLQITEFNAGRRRLLLVEVEVFWRALLEPQAVVGGGVLGGIGGFLKHLLTLALPRGLTPAARMTT